MGAPPRLPQPSLEPGGSSDLPHCLGSEADPRSWDGAVPGALLFPVSPAPRPQEPQKVLPSLLWRTPTSCPTGEPPLRHTQRWNPSFTLTLGSVPNSAWPGRCGYMSKKGGCLPLTCRGLSSGRDPSQQCQQPPSQARLGPGDQGSTSRIHQTMV